MPLVWIQPRTPTAVRRLQRDLRNLDRLIPHREPPATALQRLPPCCRAELSCGLSMAEPTSTRQTVIVVRYDPVTTCVVARNYSLAVTACCCARVPVRRWRDGVRSPGLPLWRRSDLPLGFRPERAVRPAGGWRAARTHPLPRVPQGWTCRCRRNDGVVPRRGSVRGAAWLSRS